MASARPRLYVLPGSHPCAAVEAALELKSIDYDRVVLLPIVPVIVGTLRYGGTTVPGMRLGAERIVGLRAIMRRGACRALSCRRSAARSAGHTSVLQSTLDLVCRRL